VIKDGFSKFLQTGIVLQVGSNPTINVALTVGAVTQEVTVAAEAVMVDTQSTGVGQVTAPQEVQNLPLNGREITDLLNLSGAVGQGRAFRASYPTSAVISVAGGTQGSVSYWLDGGTHNDPLSNQNLPLPFPDTIEEFKVETSSLPAQYGVHPAGAVNAVTKSGTNQFHGDVFEYLRNYIFDSKNTAYNNEGFPYVRDNLKRNQFGGTIGGPVLKDKLFFFAGWQDTIQRSTVPAQTTLPTQAMLDGDFSQCLGDIPKLAAPFGTGGFGPNQTDPANFSPIIKTLETHLPVTPVTPGNSSACGTAIYQSPVNFNENQGLARVDYHFSNRNTFFGRYFITNWEQQPGNPNLPADEGGLLIAAIDGASNRVQSLTLGDTYLITSNMVNSVRLTGTRSRNLTVQNTTLDLAGLLSDAGVAPPDIGSVYQLGPQVSKFFPNFMPGFAVTAGFGGLFNSTPSIQPYDTLEAADDLSLTHGAHQISFGMDYINLRAFATNYLFNQGQFSFDGNRTSLVGPLPISGLADYMLGYTSTATGFSQDAPIPSKQRQNVFSLYAQDAWKIKRQLTLTAGLRWDPFFGHTDPAGHVVNISLADIIACPGGTGPGCVHSSKFPTAPVGYLFQGDPGGPTNNKLSPNALNKWSPRFGLAWDPKGDGRMVVRAGIGLFWDFPNFSYDQFGFEEPWGGAVNNPAVGTGVPCTTTCITDPWGTLPGSPNPFTFIDQNQGNKPYSGVNPFPEFVGQGPTQSAYLPGALVFSYPPFSQGTKPTSILQYNLTVEKQVGKSWVLSAGYIGSQQRHLWGNNEANPGMQGPCPPGYPFPTGVACTSAGGNVPNGPCTAVSFLPPFVCSVVLPPVANAGLENNRMLQHYGTLCSATTSCYGETLLLDQDLTGNYNGLLLSARHPFAQHFTSTTNFTWSHCISDNYTTTLGFFLASQAMPFNRHYDRGNCPNADTHLIFNESLVAETPKFSNRMEQIFLGNWRFSFSLIVQSGTDISPINIVDYSGSGNGLTQRPDLISNPYKGGVVMANSSASCHILVGQVVGGVAGTAPATVGNRQYWFNPCAFEAPAPYVFGDLKNNSVFGPGSILANTALSRLFPIGEHQMVEFRWEVFNVPNHANLYAPSGALVAPSFGQPTPASTAGLGALNQTTNDPRIMQFALKYSF
jgi:TonB dependent receptor